MHAGSPMSGQTPPQLSANLVGGWGGHLVCTSRTLQDGKPWTRAQAGRIRTQLPNQATTCLWPTTGKEDATDSMEKRAPNIALLTNDSIYSPDFGHLVLSHK